MIHRRTLIVRVGASAVPWPLAARAQQPAMPVVGFLNGASAGAFAHLGDAFRQGLGETGFVEGRNERLPKLAAELASHRVAVLVGAGGENSALAAKAATASIPIVFIIGGDPVD